MCVWVCMPKVGRQNDKMTRHTKLSAGWLTDWLTCVYFVSISLSVCLCLNICQCKCTDFVFLCDLLYERKFLELKLKYHLMGNDLSLRVLIDLMMVIRYTLRYVVCVRACICVTNYALNKFNSDFRFLTLGVSLNTKMQQQSPHLEF